MMPFPFNSKPLSFRAILATCCLMPLAVGCSSAQEASTEPTPTGAPPSPTSTAAPTGENQNTASASTETEAVSTDSSTAVETSSSAAPQTVNDYCAGVCEEFSRTQVQHPTLGSIEVVTYGKITGDSGAAPQSFEPSYAIYRDGSPIGIYTATGQTVLTFGPGAALGNMTWNPESQVQDKYGNLYFNTGKAFVVLSPTDAGYAQNGTLPPASEGEPRFTVNAEIGANNKPLTGINFDADGNALMVTEYKDGKPVSWEYNGSEFVQGNKALPQR